MVVVAGAAAKAAAAKAAAAKAAAAKAAAAKATAAKTQASKIVTSKTGGGGAAKSAAKKGGRGVARGESKGFDKEDIAKTDKPAPTLDAALLARGLSAANQTASVVRGRQNVKNRAKRRQKRR